MIISSWLQSGAFCASSILAFINFEKQKFARSIKIGIGAILSLLIFILLSNLILLHIFLRLRNMTTYEYIIQTRKLKEMNSIKPYAVDANP